MVDLECRFYPLTEIRGITQKTRARDIKNLLTLWSYKYEWCDRKGVEILEKPTTALQAFTAMARQILSIDKQIDCAPFAWFIMLLLEDEEFSSMPWEVRSEVLFNESGFEVTERTLRNWASYLFRGEYLMKDKEQRTVWCTIGNGTARFRFMVENPEEDEQYRAYYKERKELLDALKRDGYHRSEAYKTVVCHLWEKYERIYYYCYQLSTNAVNQETLYELVRLARECVFSKDQTSSDDCNIESSAS